MPNRIARREHSWLDGHLLGNGDVGAVVWGNGDAVRVGLSKHDVNDLRAGSDPSGCRWAHSYTDMRRRVLDGERAFLDGIANVEDPASGPPSQLAAGCLSFEVGRGVPVTGFEQSLDLHCATVSSTMTPTNSGRTWRADFADITLHTRVLAERNVVLVQLSSRLPQALHWGFTTHPAHALPTPEYTLRDGLTCMHRHLPMDADYAVAIHAPGETYTTPLGVSGLLRFGGDLGDAQLLVALATSWEGDDSMARAATLVQDALAAEAADRGCLQAAHAAWWAAFWARSSITHGDRALEEIWEMGVYLLGSSTRPNTSPPNLQGLWNQYDHPPWSADFHLNTNVQECQWLACISNHPELQAALVNKTTGDWHANLKAYTQHSFESEGISVPLCVDWLGRPIGFLQLDLALSMSAWICWHLWQQWEYTQDRALLADQVYPFLKEAAVFYFDVLHRRDDGLFHTELTQSPEQLRENPQGKKGISYGSDAVIDIAFIKTLMANLVEAAALMEEPDLAFTDRCRDIRDHLPVYPTEGGVWIDYATCFFHTGDAPGRFQLSHRHPSRLTPIYPCGEFGLHSSLADLDLARRSYAEFRSYGSEGFSGWSMAWQAIIAARLGMPEEAETRLHEFRELYLFPNGVSSHNRLGEGGEIFQIEALLGAAAAINEALIQTAGGVIHLFAGVPAERAASFTGFRVPGGFCLSARKVAKEVLEVSVYSPFGGTVRIANPWADQSVVLEGQGTLVEGEPTLIALTTTPDGTSCLRPQAAGA